MPVLEVTDLVVSYGQIEAVRGVSFRVEEGQIVALIGANGAGKTTTLSAISGLHRPRRGSIKFRGEEISRWPSHRIVAAGVVQVPEGRAILARMTVLENLEIALRAGVRGEGRPDFGLGAGGKSKIQNPKSKIEITPNPSPLTPVYERFPVLYERRNGPAGNLSGGEQQMLAIARALLARPMLLLLDEPSMGLAPLLVKQIFDLVGELNAEGRTILLVEQNSRKALQLAHYAYVLDRGRIVLEGTGASLLNNEQVAQTYLGVKS